MRKTFGENQICKKALLGKETAGGGFGLKIEKGANCQREKNREKGSSIAVVEIKGNGQPIIGVKQGKNRGVV